MTAIRFAKPRGGFSLINVTPWTSPFSPLRKVYNEVLAESVKKEATEKKAKQVIGRGTLKLSDEDVAEMRRLRDTNGREWTYWKLAEKFGVTREYAQKICQYEVRVKDKFGNYLP